MYGFNGQMLRVSLDSNRVETEKIDDLVLRRNVGGRGLALHYLIKEQRPRIDPLGPENLLIFATGGTTGIPLAGFSRYGVYAKSPLTGGFGEAEAGGFWGPELKRAGFDMIIITGISPRPIYVWVHDGFAEIRDAFHLWGKTTKEAQEIIRAEVKDPLARIASIGPGGENLVNFACILNELKFANGRSGLGAVMGSKHLKAIAVRGHKRVMCEDPQTIADYAKWFNENWKGNPSASSRNAFGTAEMVSLLNVDGILPTKNFKEGWFDKAEKISGEEMKNSILIGNDGCFACPIRCKRIVKGIEPFRTDPSYGGPEYETIAAFGSLCGIDDISAVALANQLCNAYGLDTISTGCAIAFAIECYENGNLMKADTSGLEMKFGNKDSVLEAIEMIARRKGFGDALADGVMRASQHIGKATKKYALHVKGKEIPMHEPRGKVGLGLQYALSPSGADHMQAGHDASFEKDVSELRPIGIFETVSRLDIGPKKVGLFKYLNLWWSLLDCACVCKFVFVPHPVGVFKINHLVEIINATTGWDTSLFELMIAAERSINLARIFNLREGLSSADDSLPQRFFEPLESGPRKGASLQKHDLRKAIKLYYEMMGWDVKTGTPKLAKLYELGLTDEFPGSPEHG